jgi:hypothetical protein
MGIPLGDPSKPARGDDIRQGSRLHIVPFILTEGPAVVVPIAIAVAAAAYRVGGLRVTQARSARLGRADQTLLPARRVAWRLHSCADYTPHPPFAGEPVCLQNLS